MLKVNKMTILANMKTLFTVVLLFIPIVKFF